MGQIDGMNAHAWIVSPVCSPRCVCVCVCVRAPTGLFMRAAGSGTGKLHTSQPDYASHHARVAPMGVMTRDRKLLAQSFKLVAPRSSYGCGHGLKPCGPSVSSGLVRLLHLIPDGTLSVPGRY